MKFAIVKSDLIKLGGENSELVGQIGESQNRIENLLESLSSSESVNQELQNKLSTLEEVSEIQSNDLNEALNLISNFLNALLLKIIVCPTIQLPYLPRYFLTFLGVK